MSTENLDFKYNNKFLCGLFQKDLHNELVLNYDIISSYFLRSISDSRTDLTINVINYLHQKKHLDVDPDDLYAYLLNSAGLIKEEALPIVDYAMECHSEEDSSEFTDVVRQLRNVANIEITERASKLSNGDPNLYVKYIKEFEYKKSFSETIQIHYLNDKTSIELMEEHLSSDKVLPSSFDFINEASHLGGYPNAQIIMVTSPPGGGKTLFMMKEGMHFASLGFKVLYVALADMNMADFYIRMNAMRNSVPFSEATINFEDSYNSVQDIAENFAVIIQPSGVISMDDIVEICGSRLNDFDVVMGDYDSQFRIDRTFGNMYEDAVQPYIAASKLKMNGKTVFLGSQPRTAYYACEYLDLNSAGESSKKQHSVDFILSIGTNDETSIPCGYISNPKARRGFNKFKVPYVRTIDGNMHKVPFQVYQKLRGQIDDPTLTNDKLQDIIMSCGGLSDGSIPTISNPSVPGKSDLIATNPLISAAKLGSGGNTPPIF